MSGDIGPDGARGSAQPHDLAADGAAWRVVNDGVMGGISSARLDSGGGRVRFSGEVRTEFNGGFASAKRALPACATGLPATAIRVRARGDGHRYRFTVFTRDERGAPRPHLYYAEFDTVAGQPTEHWLPLAQFRASLRGRPVPDAPPLRWADAIGVGLMLLKSGHRDGRGPFALEVLQIVPAVA